MEAAKEASLARIAKEHGVDLMYLFGSQVASGLKILRGMEVEVLDPLTDLDVGIVTSSPLPPPARRGRFYADLSITLSNIFEPFPGACKDCGS